MKKRINSKQFLNTEDAERYCGVKTGTFSFLGKRGLAPARHWIDNGWRYWRNDLNLWMRDRKCRL